MRRFDTFLDLTTRSGSFVPSYSIAINIEVEEESIEKIPSDLISQQIRIIIDDWFGLNTRDVEVSLTESSS